MSKFSVKDIIIFLKMFGISSLFFIAGIVICFIGRKYLFVDWPEYVIVSVVLIVAGIVILIIETIRYIKTHNKKLNDDLDILKNYLDSNGYLSWVEQQEKNKKEDKDEKNL